MAQIEDKRYFGIKKETYKKAAVAGLIAVGVLGLLAAL